MMSSVIGQCVFPDYEKYGLICDEAHFLCGYEMHGFTGRLLPGKSPKPQPFPLCAGQGQADNIQWFSFIPDDINIELVLRYSNCTGNGVNSPGLQVGILNSCELDNSGAPIGSIFCVEGTNYSDIVITPDPLDIEIGQLYYLFIDGFANSACDYEIDVIQGVCVEEPDTTLICVQDCGIIYDLDHFSCTLSVDTFVFNPSGSGLGGGCGTDVDELNTSLDSIICIEWNIQPDTGFTYISSSFEYFDSLGVLPTLILEWTSEGNYTIEPIIHFNPLYASCGGGCDCTDDVIFSIEITQNDTIYLPEVELCPGECVDFCDDTYCQTGQYSCFNQDLCLVEILTIVDGQNVIVDEGIFFFCLGECFEFRDVMYCDANDYSVSDAPFCDTTYLFQLEELSLTIDLAQADDLINCSILEAYLDGEWNTNYIGNINSAWLSELGDTIAFGSKYTATEDGNYTFIAWPEGIKGCALSMMHSVNKDDEVPSANLTPPMLNCDNPSDNIIFDSQDDIMSTEWIGPNGFLSNGANPIVDQAGMYEVTITATNGCKSVLNTQVMGDFEEPDVNVDFSNLTCSEDIPTSEYTSMSTIVSHLWTRPDGSDSADDVLNLNSAGNYSLEVTATNGCTNTADFDVVDMSYDPSLQLNEDRIWRCMDTEIPLDLSNQEIQDLKYIWTSIEGSVLSNTINLTITSPGIYILTTEDTVFECIGTDTVRIVEDPNPFVDVELSILPPICEDGIDGAVEIMAFDGGEGPYTYEIDGKTYSDLEDVALEAGIYNMDVFDVFGCFVSKAIEVPPTEAFIVDVEPELTIRFGKNITLTFETTLEDSEIGLIEWSNEDGEILSVDREFDLIGDFIEFINLRVENIDGCEVISKIAINLSSEVDIYFPNVFSPNDDGNNDRFVLYSDGFPKMADDLKIFDRAGELIYKSTQTAFNETQTGWNGTFNGKLCQPGVYVFILEYTLLNGRKQTKSGSITLVR